MTETARSVAFLRGINVGGHRVTSDRLIEVFAELGYEEVSTFLASGNVVFGHPSKLAVEAAAEAMADALESALGFPAPTTIRSAVELRAIDDRAPFSDDELDGRGKPQIMLLFEPVADEVRSEVLALATDDDLLAFGPRELHWLPRAGIKDTGLDVDHLGDLVGQNTMRTANTIRRLVAKT